MTPKICFFPNLALAHNNNSEGSSPREDDDVPFSQILTSDDDDGMSSSSQESHDGDEDIPIHGDDAPFEEDFDIDALAAIADDVEGGFGTPMMSSLSTPTNNDEQEVSKPR